MIYPQIITPTCSQIQSYLNIESFFEYAIKILLSFSSILLLWSQGIAYLLHNYLNSKFVDILITISMHNIRVGYQGFIIFMQQSNHKSIISHIDIIEISIKLKLSKDWIKLLFELFMHYFCSLIDLTSKKSNDI